MNLAAALTALAATAALAAVPPPASLSSRAPEKGCVWKLLSSATLGISVPYQRCDFGYRVIDFFEGKKQLIQSMKDTGKKEDLFPVILVYEKKADEGPDEAIRRIAFKDLTRYKRKHCVVVAKHVAYLGLNKAAFTISPDAEYAAKAAKEAGDDIPEPPCGNLGEAADYASHFEFHPLENPRRFVFVSEGQDTPLFDETAIKFLP